MKRDGASVVVAFPRRLMSSARSSVGMPSDYARELLNVYATADGAGSKRNGVVAVGDEVDDGLVQVLSYLKSGVGVQVMVVTTGGRIKLLEEDGSWTQVYDGLDIYNPVYTTNFAGKLILANGINPMLAWDGEEWLPVTEKVVDPAPGLTYISGTSFSIETDPNLYSSSYRELRFKLGATTVTANWLTKNTVGNVVTFTLDASVLTGALSEVAYTAEAPRVGYIYAAHDRLWGLGQPMPEPGLPSYHPFRARVFYTYGVNDETAWHDPEGAVPSINLADKSSGSDELVAMAVKDGMTIFLLRRSAQIWTGATPGIDGDFTWQKTIPVGAVHGRLVVELPNDIAFVSDNGLRTLSRSLQTEQLDLSDVGSEVDPTIAGLVSTATTTLDGYLGAQSVVYPKQGWFALRMGTTCLVFQVGGAVRGWTQFDGIFGTEVGGMHVAVDGTLYLTAETQLYKYDESVWSDEGEPIATRWWTPWLRLAKPGKRWANRAVEVLVSGNDDVELTLTRYRNLDDGSGVGLDVPVISKRDYWDTPSIGAGGLDVGSPGMAVVRDHFVADEVAWAVESNSTEGPLTLFALRVRGMAER